MSMHGEDGTPSRDLLIRKSESSTDRMVGPSKIAVYDLKKFRLNFAKKKSERFFSVRVQALLIQKTFSVDDFSRQDLCWGMLDVVETRAFFFTRLF